MAEIINLIEANFDEEVINYNGVAVVDFWATWCGPCRALAPIIKKVADADIPDVKVCKLNVEEAKPIAVKYNIDSVPTILVFQDGELRKRHTGLATNNEIIDMIAGVLL